MKKSVLLFTLVFVFLIAGSFKGHETIEPSIEGTWELQSFYNYDGENVIDTIKKSDGYRQVKMYSKEKIMWTRYVPDEPNGRFGYGSYRVTGDSLIEVIEYGDDDMMKALDTMRNFTFELILKQDTFSQITVDSDGNRTFSENYKRID
ncbi:hypothetical protein [Flagellimonas lutimaris]|jgi:hypothetical protein|uniref:hypothetical protein n=1 Tax=Flagellimonas TaxID=444459 RepID=UPI000B64C47B|nr:MAG: hypothetical protein CBB72_009135 [Muricauda sp. TMED12]|tara:strand:- start:48 stop:491 length:444 start_codon:yes stop_codon:yes gene_type:complete|mmetsp:Transcript_10077/g.15454  ORF Transcript_10077/g.15454 Transcript_10077/m.15454 type:complete len:148 (+) Transcript_10077:18-461(+)